MSVVSAINEFIESATRVRELEDENEMLRAELAVARAQRVANDRAEVLAAERDGALVERDEALAVIVEERRKRRAVQRALAESLVASSKDYCSGHEALKRAEWTRLAMEE